LLPCIIIIMNNINKKKKEKERAREKIQIYVVRQRAYGSVWVCDFKNVRLEKVIFKNAVKHLAKLQISLLKLCVFKKHLIFKSQIFLKCNFQIVHFLRFSLKLHFFSLYIIVILNAPYVYRSAAIFYNDLGLQHNIFITKLYCIWKTLKISCTVIRQLANILVLLYYSLCPI